MLVVFTKTNIPSMVNIKPFRIVTDYWSKMIPIKTRTGNLPKTDDKIISSGKATMPQRQKEKVG